MTGTQAAVGRDMLTTTETAADQHVTVESENDPGLEWTNRQMTVKQQQLLMRKRILNFLFQYKVIRLNISSRILFQLDTSRADQSFYSFSFIHQPGARALAAVVCLVHIKFRYIVLFRKQHPFMPILAHLLCLEHSCALWRFYKTNIFIFKLVSIISEMKI